MYKSLSYLSLLLVLTVFITSCKKEGNAERYFSFAGKKYGVAHAVSSGYEGVRIATFSTSEDMRPDFGTLSYVSISFKLPSLQAGTYTFKSPASQDFDASRHFWAASAALDFQFFYSQLLTDRGTRLNDITGGTVTISRDAQNYTFKYELDFDGRQVTGIYVGNIKEVN